MTTPNALRIGLLQCPLDWENAPANIARLNDHFESFSADERFDVMVLPEMWSTGFTMSPMVHGMPWKDEWTGQPDLWPEPLRAMHRWSRRHQSAVVGSLACFLMDENRCVNRCFFVTPSGELHRYDKKHLFTFAGESEAYSAGESPTIVEWRGWRIFLQICYDLRFPVFSRNSISNRYDLALYVANWPEARATAWQQLLPARALENQCYVAGVNRIGLDAQGINHAGNSVIVDPKGRVLREAESHQTVWITADLSWSELETYRAKFPVLRDGDLP